MDGDAGVELAIRFFRSYYKRLSEADVNVSGFESREFAFSHFKEEGMRRHIAFNSPSELLQYMVERVPRHAYYSTAYYQDPAAKSMDEKGWRGADLVFDIDVDHIETPCKELHDRWLCRSCGSTGWGAPQACPSCGSENVERHSWVCDTCISVARDEVLKLVDFLEMDFGFSPSDILVMFSGHRGFHIHLESESVRELSQDARREIVEYVRGIGIDPKHLLVKTRGGYRLRFDGDALGWYGRIARWALSRTGQENPTLGFKEWEEIIREAVEREAVPIDEKVTIDTKRLIRLPNSLHGKTGLRVAPLRITDLEGESLIDKVKVFTDSEALVEIAGEPPKKILDVELSRSTRRLPLYAAIYLLLNGAELSRFEVL